MPTELKENFLGGLDLDTSYYELPRNKYVDALNITRDAVSEGRDLSISNIVGNRIVEYSYPSSGKIIGRTPNKLRNTEIFFRYSTDGHDGVYEFNKDNRVINKIFECLTDSTENILNFNTVGKIVNANVINRPEGDFLFFLDCLGRPTYMNITRMKNGEYTPVTRDIINVIKAPPLSPVSVVYGNDTTTRANNLRNKLFKFQHIWVYDDYEDSVGSPESSVPLPVNILDETFTNVVTNNNVIQMVMTSGPKNVKSIKLLMSWVEKTNDWSDFVVVDVIDKAKLEIVDDIQFSWVFYNDSTYPVYDPTRRIQLYDYVPRYAVSQESPNGNVIAYAGITEGLSRELDPNVVVTVLTTPAGSGSSTGSLSVVLTFFITGKTATFSGIPAAGTVVNIKIQNETTHVISTPITYTTVAGDTANNVAAGLIGSVSGQIIVSGVGGNPNQIHITVDDDYDFNTIEIVAPASSADDNSIATWPFSTQRRIAFVYFDKNGVTNGVLYDAQVTFPAYAENADEEVLLPYVNVKIYHTPPLWAYSYTILVSKEPTQYVYWYTIDVNTDETDFIYFDVTDMVLNAVKNPTTAAVLAWTFEDGDRMRLIRNASTDEVFNYTYEASVIGIVVDPKINSVAKTGTFVKIKKAAPFTTPDYTTKEFVIQLYRPGFQQANDENLVYYEFGIQFPILFPTTDDRVHGGQVTDQNIVDAIPAEINLYEGDAYFRQRSINTSEIGIASFNVQDRNFVDFYISAVNSISGRPNTIDENLKETFFAAMIRHGQEYEANTNINNLNRFPALSFIDCDYSQGTIIRMKVRDRMMRVFQQYKVGKVPLFSQINKEPSGGNVTVTTDVLLNPIQYYVGNNGIGDAAESLASYNQSDYFCDTVRGMVCRIAGDGVDQLSVLFKINSWATLNIPLRTGEKKIYGVYDPRSSNYIISLEQTTLPGALSIPVQGVENFSASYISSTTLVGACTGGSQTLFYGVPFAPGIKVYLDELLITPFTGFNYIVGADNQIYSINPGTGVVGAAIGGAMCGIGIPATFRLGTVLGTICTQMLVTLYTSGPFAVGVTVYYDSALTTPVTDATYIVDVSTGHIYHLSGAGVVGADTDSACGMGVPGSYALGNNSGTICAGDLMTLYTTDPFAIGQILYYDSSLTMPVTGMAFVFRVDRNEIFNVNTGTGAVTSTTGLACTNNVLIVNNSAAYNITNITGLAGFTFVPDVAPAGTQSGKHTPSTSIITATVAGIDGPCSLTLYKNLVPLQCINVGAAGAFPFGSISYVNTDNIQINLQTGSC